MNENGKLPNGWTTVHVSEGFANVPLTGKKLKQKEYLDEGALPVIDQGEKFIGGYSNDSSLRVGCSSPVIVFGDHTKIIKLVTFDFVAGADGIKVLKPIGIFDPRLANYFLNAIQLPDKGYARHFQYLQKSRIPLPPLPEQHRIVAKIEELLTRLDAGVEALKQIKRQLKRYRQAVLKHAFEGKLTQDWREAQLKDPNSPLNTEPATVLLERIKVERKQALGKKYKELPPVDTTDLPDLPEGWVWASFDMVGNWCGGGTPNTRMRDYWDNGTVPWVSPKDMKKLILDDSEDKITVQALHDSAATLIRANSLLFVVRSGILRRTLPISLMTVETAVNQDIKALTPHSSINSGWLLRACNAYGEDIRHKCAKDGTTVESIEVPALQRYAIPLCSAVEQVRIVNEVDRVISIADFIEQTIDNTLAESNRLRQSILKRAFEGKLVPQDPNDEPAEKLLERIRAEREAEQERKKNGKVVVKKLVKKSRVKAKK